MKFLKYFLYFVGFLVLVFLILGLIYPKTLEVEKSHSYEHPKPLLKEKLSHMKQYNEWSPWAENDSGVEYRYEGEMGEPGSTMHWDGEGDMGKGSYTLKGFSGDSILMELHFIEPHESTSENYFVLKEKDGAIEVTWGFKQPLSWPTNCIPHLVGVDEMLGKHFEKGLKNLEELLAEEGGSADADGYEIEEVEFPGRSFFVKKDTVPFSGISEFYETNFPSIGKAMGMAGFRPTGSPCGIFERWDEKDSVAVMSAAMPVKDAKGKESVDSFPRLDLPEGKALKVAYHGAYEESGEAHEAMGRYLEEEGLNSSYTIEEYVTDPGKEPDTSKWLTNIYYLLED